MSNLLDSLKGLISNELIQSTASALGEQESGISKAVSGILPTLLGGLMQSNPSNHSMLGDLLNHAGSQESLIGDLASSVHSNSVSPSLGIGESLVKGLFGDKVNGFGNLISNFSGIKASSSNTLLNIGGTIIASFLGKKMTGDGLNFGGIVNWLGQHSSDITSAIPAGFSSFLGLSAPTSQPKATTNAPAAMSENQGGAMKWLLPLILLGILAVGLFSWLKGCNTTQVESASGSKDSISVTENIDTAMPSDSATAAAAAIPTEVAGRLDEAGNWIVTKGEAIKIKLDNGVELDAFKGSLEDKLFSFIKDPNAMPGKDIWFNFEDLLFETGKSTLKAGSEKQLTNTVEILKAYPAVKVKLGGYTDNTGDSMKNVKLSESRAKTVHGQMISKGLTATSFDAKPYEGYGPQFPVADNTTPEGRAQNRRLSLSVRAK